MNTDGHDAKAISPAGTSAIAPAFGKNGELYYAAAAPNELYRVRTATGSLVPIPSKRRSTGSRSRATARSQSRSACATRSRCSPVPISPACSPRVGRGDGAPPGLHAERQARVRRRRAARSAHLRRRQAGVTPDGALRVVADVLQPPRRRAADLSGRRRQGHQPRRDRREGRPAAAPDAEPGAQRLPGLQPRRAAHRLLLDAQIG